MSQLRSSCPLIATESRPSTITWQDAKTEGVQPLFDGLKNLGNLGSMIKQAQELGAKLQGIKEELREQRTHGSAGAGMVTVEVNGLCEVLSCQIDPSLIKPDDREMLEDLVVAAMNQAYSKAKDLHTDALQSAAGGMPGLGEVLGKLGGS